MRESPLLKQSTVRFALVAIAAVAASACGCHKPTDRVEVSGKVMFKHGEAVKRGSIEFSSVEPDGSRGGARIAEGVYFIPQEKGLKPGKYLVRIYAPTALLSGNGGPGGAGKLPEETVSPKYNISSRLTVEVGTTAEQVLDFEVEKTASK
jgi:hypothetical protein